ncbi:MAG TPA: hypothetical protein VIG24_18255, partial [Acidimicrobiia bacterium]
AGTYTFKYMEGTTETPFTVGNITEFKLDQPDENKQVFLMYATMADGTTPGIVTRDGGSSGGTLVLKDPKMMTGAEFNMAKVAISPVADFPVGKTLWCSGGGGAPGMDRMQSYMVTEPGKMKAITDPAVAATWNPDWSASASHAECSGLTYDGILGTNPKAPGKTLWCSGGGGAPGMDRMQSYMVTEPGKMKAITDPTVAATWNPDWSTSASHAECSDLTYDGILTAKT